MDLAAFNLALKTRAYTDTGTGGLRNATTPLITMWFAGNADPSLLFPYVTTDIAGATSVDAQSLDVGMVLVRMHVWHQRSGSSDPNPTLTCSNILKRIYGNWSSSTPGTAPSYGFHRHPLVIASGNWHSTIMQCVDKLPVENHEEGYLHYVTTYRLWLYQ